MVNATSVSWVRNSAFVILVLYGCLCAIIGLSTTFLPLVLTGRGPLHVWRYIFAGPCAALVGAGTLMRLRVAAIALSVLFALTGAEEMYGIAHGFSLPNPPHGSATEIVCIVIFTL